MAALSELLLPSHVRWLETTDKHTALRQMLETVCHAAAVRDPAALSQAIFEREVKMSTGLGYGVAVPHARIPTVDSFVLALGIAPEGIPYPSVLDDAPVRLIAMIAGPDRLQDGYLKLLSTLMKFLKSEKGHILSSTSGEAVSELARGYSLDLGSAALAR